MRELGGDSHYWFVRIPGLAVVFVAAFGWAPALFAQSTTGCSYSFNPSGTLTAVAKNAAPTTLNVRTNCVWSASTTDSWISFVYPGPYSGNGSIVFTVADNTATGSRRGTIRINDQSVIVQQSGISCAYAVTPAATNLPADAGTAQFAVNTDPACSWTASSSGSSWMSLNPATSSGPGTVSAIVAANTSQQPRSGTFTIAGKQISITQAGAGITFTADSIQNASSFAGGPLSPGEIFVVYGSGLGPQALTTLRTTVDGKAINSSLGGTRILFDGVPAPMLYSSAGQVSAIVPYAVAGPIAHVSIEYNGVSSKPVMLDVLPAAPGIFTVSQTGVGQGAVRNGDFSVNGPSNPASAGQPLIIYWTGGGRLSVAVPDGQLVSSSPPYPVVTFPMKVTLGGMEVQITYSGAVPTLAPGILQTNIVIPDNVPTGDAVPLVMMVGDFATQLGVTVAIH